MLHNSERKELAQKRELSITEIKKQAQDYYDEWFEEVEDSAQGPGWILAINFRPHILEEWKNYNINAFIHWGVSFETINWRTLTPGALFERVKMLISRQIELI